MRSPREEVAGLRKDLRAIGAKLASTGEQTAKVQENASGATGVDGFTVEVRAA